MDTATQINNLLLQLDRAALALTTPGVDVRAVVQTQRTGTMRMLQEYTRLKSTATDAGDLAWRLVLDAMVFRAEAEVRWLDHCESSLVRYAPIPEDTTPKTRTRNRPQETDIDQREASAR